MRARNRSPIKRDNESVVKRSGTYKTGQHGARLSESFVLQVNTDSLTSGKNDVNTR